MSIKADPIKPNTREYRTSNEDGSAIRVTMGDGRVALVGDDWRDLPLDMHNKAVRAGCECRRKDGAGSDSNVGDSGNAGPEPSGTPAPARVGTDEAVRKAMIDAINDDPPGLINETTGSPDPEVIAKYAGFTASREQFNRVWKVLHKELREAQERDDENEEAAVRQEGADIAAANAAAAAESAAADPAALDPEPVAVTVDANALSQQRAARQKSAAKKVARAERAKKPAKPAAAK